MAVPDPDAEWWSVAEVASYLEVAPATVRSYRARGQMPTPEQRYGTTWLWRPATIATWHAQRPYRSRPATE